MNIFKKKEKPCTACEACKDAIWSVYVPKGSKSLTEFQVFYIKEVLKEIGEMTDIQTQLIVEEISPNRSSMIYGSNDKGKLLTVVADLLCEGISVTIISSKL